MPFHWLRSRSGEVIALGGSPPSCGSALAGRPVHEMHPKAILFPAGLSRSSEDAMSFSLYRAHRGRLVLRCDTRVVPLSRLILDAVEKKLGLELRRGCSSPVPAPVAHLALEAALSEVGRDSTRLTYRKLRLLSFSLKEGSFKELHHRNARLRRASA